MRLSVLNLVRAVRGRLISGLPHHSFDRLSIDTRTLQPGDVFFAIAGPRFDGHDFLPAAVRRGARVVVVSGLEAVKGLPPEQMPDIVEVGDTVRALQDLARFIRSAARPTVVGVTGSNGKTTTKEMLSAIFSAAGKTLATRGNLNNHIGLPLTVSELESDHRFAVIEMGTSRPGDMSLLADIARADIGLITNVGKDHLEFFGTPEGVLAENRVLFDRLPENGVAVINLDDPLVASMAGSVKRRLVTYGLRHSEAMVTAGDITAWPMPMRFELRLGALRAPVRLHAQGDLQIANALAAAATAYAAGLDADTIVKGLEAFRPASMRLQAHQREDGAVLINDAYNANPSSVRASVESFCRSFPEQEHWLVMGDMRELGAVCREEHAEIGRWLAGQPLQRIALYGRDIRFTEAALREAGAGGRVERYRKKRYLIEALQRVLPVKKPAVLFKASRSLRLEQVVIPLLGRANETRNAVIH